MILVAALASPRFGEITALERQDVDLDAATVRVRQQFLDVKGHGLVLGPPRSRAGKRTITVPTALVPMLAAHIAEYVGPGPSALIFTTSTGRPIRRGTFPDDEDGPDEDGDDGAAGVLARTG